MSTRKILNIVSIGCAVLLIIGIFLPLYSYEGVNSSSIWDASENKTSAIIMLLTALGSLAFSLLQVMGVREDSKEGYFFAGYPTFYCINLFIQTINNDTLNYCGIGFWLLVLGAIAMGATILVSNFMSNDAPVKNPYGQQPPYGGGGYNPNQYNNGYNGYQQPQQPYNPYQQGGYNPNQYR